jgi:hypothetical protein
MRGSLRWPDVLDAFDRTKAARFAYPALELVERLCPGTVDATVLAATRNATTARGRQAVARLTPVGGSSDGSNLAIVLMWAATPVEKARLFYGILADEFGRGPRNVLTSIRALLRRLLRGSVTLRGFDERGVHPEPTPRRPRAPRRGNDAAEAPR